MALFSPAQVVGYIALALGITAFLQKSDDRLKLFNATQGLVYALHFVLLGNLPASTSALLSSLRSFLALRYRSWLLGAAIIGANVGLGAAFARVRVICTMKHVGLNVAAWALAFAVFHAYPATLSLCFLAYGLGLRHAVDADHNGVIDLNDWPDAIFSVANYLKEKGNYTKDTSGRRSAFFQYNHSDEYANGVMLYADTISKRLKL